MTTVNKHPVMEAVARKLSGITGVPPDEQRRMVGAAACVAAEMYDERIAALEAKLAEAKAQHIPVKTHHCKTTHSACECVLATIATQREEIEKLRAEQDAEYHELFLRFKAEKTANERLRQGECSTPECKNKGFRYLCEECSTALREELDKVRAERRALSQINADDGEGDDNGDD